MKNIFFVYSQPRYQTNPDHFLFGANYLKASFSNQGFNKFNLLKWPISPLQTYFLKHQNVGFQLDQALCLLPRLKAADVIVTTNDSCGLPIAALKKLGLLHTPQIYFHIGFHSHKKRQLKRLTESLLKIPEKIICFSPNTLKQFKPHFMAPPVDTQYFKPQITKFKYDLLAVGRDLGRDYQTFFKAINNLKLKALLICDPKNILNLDLPNNLEVKFSLPYNQVRKYYHQAKIIVIPTKKNTVSGQVNLLESLACNKPVIAARTPALAQLFSSPPCLYYQPQNHQDLQKQIIKLLKNPKIIKPSRQHILPFSSQNFARQLNQIIKSI